MCVGGRTLDTGTLREMWPYESALVSPLSSRYGASAGHSGSSYQRVCCAGGLGGFWGRSCVAPKIADSEEMVVGG